MILPEINNSDYEEWLHKKVVVISKTSSHKGETGEIVGITKTMHFFKVKFGDSIVNLSPLSIKISESST